MSYQHGQFNRYFVGLMAYGFLDGKPHRANAYGLWSDYFRHRLLRDSRLYDASTTFVCGMLRSPGPDVEAKDRSSEGRVRVLVVSESQGRTEEIVPFVAQLVDRRSLRSNPETAARGTSADAVAAASGTRPRHERAKRLRRGTRL